MSAKIYIIIGNWKQTPSTSSSLLSIVLMNQFLLVVLKYLHQSKQGILLQEAIKQKMQHQYERYNRSWQENNNKIFFIAFNPGKIKAKT